MLSALDEILPEYKKISAAPEFDYFDRRYRNTDALEQAIQEESKKRYKALDTATGSVFLVQNPAVMSWQIWRGATVATRMPPQYVGTIAEIKKKGPIGIAGAPMTWSSVN